MRAPLPRALAPLTVPASWLYGWAIARRNARFDRGIGVQRIGRPVISVGNITTGGTGKTPMVMWIAEVLRQASLKPVIAMRGYKSSHGKSDEQLEYADRLPDVPVIANPDRIASLREFLRICPACDCVVLDDGFQHRQLYRDLDLLLIDATADTFHDRLLPAGNLREPLKSLRRADAVIVTHAEHRDPWLEQEIVRHHGEAPIAWAHHEWRGLLQFEEDGRPNLPLTLDWLRSKRVMTMLGIGKPQSVLDQLEALGAKMAVNVTARDHEPYNQRKLAAPRKMCDGCDATIVTLKDWVKLRPLLHSTSWPTPIIVPQLAIEFLDGDERLREMLLNAVRVPKARQLAR